MTFSEPLALLKYGCHSVATSYPNSSSVLSASAKACAERVSWLLHHRIVEFAKTEEVKTETHLKLQYNGNQPRFFGRALPRSRCTAFKLMHLL